MSLVSAKTAIVLIEYQNEFTSEGGKLHSAVKPVMEATQMLSNSVALMNHARSKGAKIIHVPISFADGSPEINGRYGILKGVKDGAAFLKSNWGSEFQESMKPSAGDIVIEGKR